ncbi:MAG: hypothetical protein CMM85_15410 [Rhodothermaceae bacterium]|nr:hypothetical protein [Rhodothermaceae bacterium]
MRHSLLLRPALLLLALFLTADLGLAQARLGPGLLDELGALAPGQTTTVVVTFDSEGPLTAAQRSLLTGLGITQGMTFQSLPIAGVLATPAQVASLQNTAGVVSIWPNHALTYSNADATELTGVDGARTNAQFRNLNGGLPISGRGVGMVVNDSGIEGLHPDLTYGQNLVQNVLGSTNLNAYSGLLPITYLEDQPSTDTNSGHGTHVAATVGGTGAASGGLHEGVAPGADLIGYGSGGVVLVLDGIGGIDYAMTHQFQYGIRIVTNSWGSSGDFDPADPINQSSYRAYLRNISVFFAAGNDGPGADTHNPYAQAPWVMSVAAGNKDGETLADFSSRGVDGESGTFTMFDGTTWTYRNEPVITAPGVGIISACATGSPICATGIQPDNPRYASLQGTSMATPHVAGVAALMYEADPTLTPAEVRTILEETATVLDYEAWEAGSGYVNAYAAVAVALGLDPTPYLRTIGEGEGETPLPAGVVLVDDAGDTDQAGTDILDVSFAEVDASAFTVTLRVADLDQATPSSLLAAGFQVGAMQDYGVEFDLQKADLPTVRYSLTARRTLAMVGLGTVGFDEPSFDYGVRAADGAGRGIGDVAGTWDSEAGTITWTVPVSVLTVAAPPADLTGDIDQTGRPAQAGDKLAAFVADVATSVWGGVVGLSPAQTQYDTASGTTRTTLGGDSGEEEEEEEEEQEPGESGAQVVVSVIDSGINPYHAFYHAGSEIYPTDAPSAVTPAIKEQFGIDAAHTLSLTRTGDFNADFAADAALWASVQPGEVYWVEGTNILAVSFDPGTRILMPDDEDDTHGVGTSAAVLRANPEAVMLFVEGITDASETFAFTHPSVDIVSTSYGAIGSLPLPGHINDSYTGVVTNGKLHLGAADNSPSTAIQDGTAGPWWSIGVAGYEEETSEGKQLVSGTLPDVVADFTQTLPYCASCEDGQQSVGGTSFATPRTAGTLSSILLTARREAGHLGPIADVDGVMTMAAGNGFSITNWDLRRAMEEAAYIPTLDEYDPVEGAFDTMGLPVPPAGAYALVGWGAITTDPAHGVVTEALAQLGIGDAPTRSKSVDTCEFMASVVTARHVYWDNLNVGSQSFLIGGPDDYRYCNATDGGASVFGGGAALTASEAGALSLGLPFPNPVRSQATVAFELPADGAVRLAVYDLLGREVAVLAEGVRPAGAHTARVEAGSLASGVYLVRLDAAGQALTHRMTVVR